MDSYFLPDGNKIDIDGCVMAVLSTREFPMHFLDTESGNVCIIDSKEALNDLVEKIGDSRQYLEITHFDDKDYSEIVSNFLDDIIAVMASKSLYNKLKKFLDEEGWKKTIAELEKDKDGWIHGWSQYIHDEGYDQAVDWLMNIPNLKVTEKFEGCGDCEICKAMREGKNGYGDLMEAFAIQKAKQKPKRNLNS